MEHNSYEWAGALLDTVQKRACRNIDNSQVINNLTSLEQTRDSAAFVSYILPHLAVLDPV